MAPSRQLHMKKRKNRAVFLDRDGVLNRIVYHRDIGVIDTPFTVGQFTLLPGAARAIREINRLGLKAIVVSNQPGIAKGHFSHRTLDEMTSKLERNLKRAGARLDAIYYCLHHPHAVKRAYRKRCACRKPNPGLLKQAARKFNIALKDSFIIGDSITDIQAGKRAGCRTVLLGNFKCDLCKFMHAKKVKPDYIACDIIHAVALIREMTYCISQK
jgi:D-glycero-D-manno-heptose 1,7-bisphosphate phosphatase